MGSLNIKNFTGISNSLTLVSSTLMESGSDNLRNALGTVVFTAKDSTYGFDYYKARCFAKNDDDAFVEDLREIDVLRIPCHSDKLSFIETNPSNISLINNSVATPNYKIPFRLYANESTVYGDVHWREIFTGGQWADQNFTNLIDTSKTYYDCTTTIAVPIDYKELRKIEFDTTEDLSSIPKCALVSNYLDYNHLAQDYQNWASGLSNELLIPNYDIVSSYYYNKSREASESSVVLDLLADGPSAATIEKQIGWSEEKSHVYKYHFPYCYETEEGTEYYNLLKKDQYFGSYFVNTGDNEAYREAAITHQQNIIYDQHYYDFLEEHSITDYEELLSTETLDIDSKLSTFYNISLEFDRHMVEPPATEAAPDSPTLPAGRAASFSYEELSRVANKLLGSATGYRFTKIIDQYNFSSKFLELLKDIDEGTITDVKRNMLDFHYTQRKTIAVPSDDPAGGMIFQHDSFMLDPGQKITLPSTNFLHFLLYSYNNYDVALNDNYVFMGPPRPEHVATSATDSLYRNMNTQNIIGVIDAAYDVQNAYFRKIQTDSGTDFLPKSESILEKLMSPLQKFREVLAYKIEKFGSTPTGDYSTQVPIQKFWMFNAPNAPDKLKLVDSQVKYDKNYTYKITAYTLIVSHKYKYENFRLTKQIGTGKLLPDAESTLQYCLQFYNPNNNQISPQLLTPVIDSTLDDVARSALQGLNEFASSEIEVTEFPQVADFHLYIEPCLELVEVPFYQKTIKVLENPPNAINVVPFHFIDDSNRLGFKIGQDSFIQRTYPEIITPEDAVVRDDYLSTKEYILNNKIKAPSESPARYIEMYRIKNKPTAFSDFKDALVATMDLRIFNDVYNYADHIAADEIFPNRKYYYVFRLLNENRMPGPLSQIIEAELVNDGGYVYSLFDTVDSSEFSPNKITTNTVAFKKIMQIEPHLNQMSFDMSDVNYGDYASNQVGNLIVGTVDEKIWSKKFKIRLTSKKTGKKLDLNMSFNRRVKDISKLREIPAPPSEICDPDPPQIDQDDMPIEVYEEAEGGQFEKSSYECEQASDVEDDPAVEDVGSDPAAPVYEDDPTVDDPGETEDIDLESDDPGDQAEPEEDPPDDNEVTSETPEEDETTPEYNCLDYLWDPDSGSDSYQATGLQSGQQALGYYGSDLYSMGATAPGQYLPFSMIKFTFTGEGPSASGDVAGPLSFVLQVIDSLGLVDSSGTLAMGGDIVVLRLIYQTVWYFNNKYYCHESSPNRYRYIVPNPEMMLAQLLVVLHYAGQLQTYRVGAECPTMMAYTPPMEAAPDSESDYPPGSLFFNAQTQFRNWIEADAVWHPEENSCWEDRSTCGEEAGFYKGEYLDKVFYSLRYSGGAPELSYDPSLVTIFKTDSAGGRIDSGDAMPPNITTDSAQFMTDIETIAPGLTDTDAVTGGAAFDAMFEIIYSY